MKTMTLSFYSAIEARDLDVPWPDVYFTPAYGAAEQAAGGGVWEVAIWEPGPVIYPYLRRPVDQALTEGEEAFDIVSPYGYAGTWAPMALPLSEWANFRSAFADAMASRGCVAEFQRLSSLVPGADRLLQADSRLHGAAHNHTVLIDLQAGYEAYWTGSDKRSRTAIRKARKLGYTVQLRTPETSDLEGGGDFRRLYDGTMKRVGASARYFFPDAYYEALTGGLGDNLLLAEVRSPSGEVVAAALFMRWAERWHYHLSGSERDAARDGVNNLMMDGLIHHVIEGNHGRWLHLGGGVRDGDSLYKFKVGFSGKPIVFRVAQGILDQTHYDRLVARRAISCGKSENELIQSGFFPAYRAA